MNVQIHKFPVYFGIVLLLLGGCNKSDNPTTPQTDPTKAKERVSQANQILMPKLALIFSSQGSDTSAFNFSSAVSLYQEALDNDPNNLDAHFGYAAARTLNVMNDPDMREILDSARGVLNPINLTFSKNVSARRFISDILPASILPNGKNMFPQTPLNFYEKFHKKTDIRAFSYYQDRIESQLLPMLNDVISHLQVVTQNRQYAMYITNREMGGSLEDSIRIDLTEIYLLLACMNFVDAMASFGTAYNIDYTPTDSIAVHQAWQVNSPFLAFRSNGNQRMKDTKTRLLAMAQNIQDGINFLLTDTPHPGVDLIKYNPNDFQDYVDVVNSIDTVKLAFTGPLSINDEKIGQITVNISQFFDNAISNYKTKIPAYTVQVQRGSGNMFIPILFWTETSFNTWTIPDPTMNGLLPGMTDAVFKNLVGLTAQNWQPYIVIGN